MPTPCRVLVLNERDPEHPKAGGAEIHVAEIFRRLAARGYEITLASSSFPGAAVHGEIDGMRARRLGALPFYYPRVAWACARETRQDRYDVVVECLNKVPFYSPVYSGVPVLALCHHLFGEVAFQQVPWPVAAVVWMTELLIPYLYKKPPFVAISESSEADLVRRGIPVDRVRVSHCGITPPEQSVDTTTPRPQRLAYIGRLETYKNIDVMLRAAKQLVPRFPELELLVIGRGSERASLEALAQNLGLAKRTRFTGFIDDVERDALLAETRVCICPSEKEGWGLTVIESNALGTPVVASDVDGLRDSVRDGQTGFLVPSGDVSAFAERIATLLGDDALSTQMSKAALEWSRTFDWEIAADEMAVALEDARCGR